MSRLELDDQILNHRKFVRAVRSGGSEAIHMWLGIRAYVGQNLSDGFVPSDMVDDVRGPIGKKRTLALNALADVGLVHRVEDGALIGDPCERCSARLANAGIVSGGLLMHDFTDWSRSKSQVLADRERARERQAQSRGKSHGKSRRDTTVTTGDVTRSSTTTSATSSAFTTTPKPPELSSLDPEAKVPCPVPLPLDDQDFAGLQLDVGIPRNVAEANLRAWAADERAAKSNPRPVGAWVKCGLKALRGKWSDGANRAGMRALAERVVESEQSAPRVKSIDDIMRAEGA